MLALDFFLCFLVGCVVGSVVNFCASRLPYEKSLLWPGSRCFTCYQPIRWYHQVPLLSYVLLGGKCPTCAAPIGVRIVLVELGTGLAFVGVFYLEVVRNVLDVPLLHTHHEAILAGEIPAAGWVLFGVHALLVALLLLVSVCDIEHREIPLSITITGTLLGLGVSVLWPWPWPGTQGLGAVPVAGFPPVPTPGLYPWPVWHELPDWLAPGSWTLGLATGLAGALVGMIVLRGVRALFAFGRGIEGLGMGDADLMMMAGAFVGWQPILLAFFVAVFPGLVLGLAQLAFRGDQALPFGPPLCVGVLVTLWTWPVLGEQFQPLLMSAEILGILAVFGGVFLLGAGFVLRWLRG